MQASADVRRRKGIVKLYLRQRLTQKERDSETALDYFGARYYSSSQGRFSSPDVFWKDSDLADPQSWNKYVYARNNPLKYIDPNGEKAEVTIETDEKNKKGIIRIKADIALWTQKGNNISKENLKDAAFHIENGIENRWSGTFEKDGIAYTVVAEINVKVYESEEAATEAAGLRQDTLNVIEMSNGPARSDADSYVQGRLWGPDTGKWNIRTVMTSTPSHEFGHLIGLRNRDYEPTLMGKGPDSAVRATSQDYIRAFGDEIDSHRLASGTQQWGLFKIYGPPQNATSKRIVDAPIPANWGR